VAAEKTGRLASEGRGIHRGGHNRGRSPPVRDESLECGVSRLYAFAITPRKGEQEDDYSPEGGALLITAELKGIIYDNIASAAFDKRTPIDFNVNVTTRSNEVRDYIINFAYADAAEGRAAALGIAHRLAGAMDNRSTPCLLIIAALEREDERVVTFWTFPRDEAFRLRNRRSGPTIQILSDVFSKTSRLRKAAYFRGRRLRNHFLSGKALDFQADHANRELAEFWIARFLQCRHEIGSDTGTRLVARIMRKAYERCSDPEDQEELYAAMIAMRRSPQKRISLYQFADRYLREGGTARNAFMQGVPNTESVNALFEFSTPTFDEALQFRVFQLRTGVFVSSPLKEIGESVQLSEGAERRLSCEGVVVDERLRTRHG
jgi:hypothetical protein